MQTFDTGKSIIGASRLMTDPKLINLLTDRVEDWTSLGLLNLTHLVIIEVGDTDASIIDELGFSPLINPFDGLRHGMEGFVLRPIADIGFRPLQTQRASSGKFKDLRRIYTRYFRCAHTIMPAFSMCRDRYLVAVINESQPSS